GGSYGPRNALYVEHPLVLWAAKRLARPVKWTSDRTETMLTDYQARDLVINAALGFGADGRLIALHTENISNIGAFSASWIPLVKGIEIMTGLYRIPAVSARAMAIQSNTPPTYPYRSAGRPEVMYALERMMDMAAEATGLDRIEIRRRNLIAPGDMPYDNGFGLTHDSGDYPQALEAAVELSDWDGFPARRNEARKRGRLRGIGIANYADLSTGYPREWTEIDVRSEGEIMVQIGTMATGQGHETTFSQLVAEVLEVPFDAIDVGYGDTDKIKDGGGTHSGRSMRMGAIVLCDASNKIIARARRIASHVLEAAEADIEYAETVFTVAGTDRRISLFDVAAAARDRTDLAEDLRGELKEEADVHFAQAVIGSGCHVCEVEIDPDTGVVEVVDWTAVDDVGRAINPMTLDGQTHGGVLQGIGQALMENCAYDTETGQMIGATFMDYAMPRADIVPAYRTKLLEVP
ncbi:MAG: xanthine dehydrogenase family protein molybdopterin-binding subunit, partial [Alphaproteobacteria bacterium]